MKRSEFVKSMAVIPFAASSVVMNAENQIAKKEYPYAKDTGMFSDYTKGLYDDANTLVGIVGESTNHIRAINGDAYIASAWGIIADEKYYESLEKNKINTVFLSCEINGKTRRYPAELFKKLWVGHILLLKEKAMIKRGLRVEPLFDLLSQRNVCCVKDNRDVKIYWREKPFIYYENDRNVFGLYARFLIA